jgi:hypothetical protein
MVVVAAVAAAWRRWRQLGSGSLAAAAWRRQLGGGSLGAAAATAATAVATKTPAVTAMAGAQTTINNQLKAVAETGMEMVTMTAIMTTMKTKAEVAAVAD